METLSAIQVRKVSQSRLNKSDMDRLEFGKLVSDHMLVSDYSNGEWDVAQIVPFTNLSMSPATLALHYGQTVFEGMKAFRMNDGRVNIFRIEKHYDRFVRSLQRMCMAVPPRDIFMEGMMRLVELDQEWVPHTKGAAMYIRPFVYASEAKFGVKISDQYRFLIFTGPVPSLYAKPIRVKVETEYIRAAKGGTGAAKCGGNYGGAYYPTQLARNEGYDQVLWTSGAVEPTIEESGMMNVMFVLNGVLVTPPLSDSILDGVTRDSLTTLANEMGIPCEERSVTVRELEDGFRNNQVTEAFGAGTAAVVAPIATIGIGGMDFDLPEYTSSNILYRLADRLDAIRTGNFTDVFGWNHIV